MVMTMSLPCFNFCTTSLSVLSLITIFLCQTRTEAPATYVYHICPNTTTFTDKNTYRPDFSLLFASLSDGYRSPGFHSASISARNSIDKIYGLVLCRGDLTTDECKDCLDAAEKDVADRCPIEETAVAWYDECMVRYSNQYILSNMVTDPAAFLRNTMNISDQDRFDLLGTTTMKELASEVSNIGVGDKKFATKEANFTALQTLYTLAQCTPDLSGSDCNRCLERAIETLPGCCGGKQGGRLLYPSCTVRFEVYPFYQTVAHSPPPHGSATRLNQTLTRPKGKGPISSLTIIVVVVPISIFVLLFAVGYRFHTRQRNMSNAAPEGTAANDIATVESLQFDLATIETATNMFSDENKLGKGGFGAVYKGLLYDGQEIAIKRLSKNSGQGAEEFKNEAVLITKLQHRNLVRLLGFCIEEEEKILVYEYLPNKSLDYFLYEPTRKGQLDWLARNKIIQGIARGILYLHEDSRLRIIHRDLKASNILLDIDMNPKISDFGMAKIFEVNQIQGNSAKIAGTFGYMSPEYVMLGQFSMKSDVYSFGILILEIITGKKISSFHQTNDGTSLLSYAWKHWTDGTALELLDPCLEDSYSRDQVIRCLHIGLLSVQYNPDDRPTMASIVLMLNSPSVPLPLPLHQPGSVVASRSERNRLRALELDQSKSKTSQGSVDEASITVMLPR